MTARLNDELNFTHTIEYKNKHINVDCNIIKENNVLFKYDAYFITHHNVKMVFNGYINNNDINIAKQKLIGIIEDYFDDDNYY